MEFTYYDDSDQYYMSIYGSDSYSDDDWDDDDEDDDDGSDQEEEEEESCYDSDEEDDSGSDEESCYDSNEDDEYCYYGDEGRVSYIGEEICYYDSEEDEDDETPVTFLVFDLETTGLDEIDNRIIEMAIVDLDGHGQSSFHSLVNPGCPVTNSNIHGITNNMVNRPHVPRMQELIPNMHRFVESRQKPKGYIVWVAHNARSFDVPFLANEFKRCATPIPSNWLFLDTLPLACEVMKNTGSQVGGRVSLQALREHYGIPLTGSAHSAMSDVHCLAEVLNRIVFDLNLSSGDLLQKTFTVKDLACCLLS